MKRAESLLLLSKTLKVLDRGCLNQTLAPFSQLQKYITNSMCICVSVGRWFWVRQAVALAETPLSTMTNTTQTRAEGLDLALPPDQHFQKHHKHSKREATDLSFLIQKVGSAVESEPRPHICPNTETQNFLISSFTVSAQVKAVPSFFAVAPGESACLLLLAYSQLTNQNVSFFCIHSGEWKPFPAAKWIDQWLLVLF